MCRKNKIYVEKETQLIGLVSLFNGISTLFRLFDVKAIRLKRTVVVLFNP